MTDEIANVDDSEYDAAFEEFAGGGDNTDAPQESEDPTSEDAEEVVEQEGGESDGEQSNEDGEQAETPKESEEVANLKAQLQAANHKFNSVNGRINAYQRQIEQLKQQQRAPQPSAGDNPQGSGMSDAKWEQLKQDYPDIAEAMEAQLNGVRSQYQNELQQLRQQVEPIQQKQQEAEYNSHISSQMEALNSAHPDWQDVVRTAEYTSWLQQQPQAIQQLMGSTSAEDNIYLLNTFKSTRSNAQATPDTNPVQQRRERQLQQAKTIPNRSRSGGQNAIAEDDFDAAFDYYASKIK